MINYELIIINVKISFISPFLLTDLIILLHLLYLLSIPLPPSEAKIQLLKVGEEMQGMSSSPTMLPSPPPPPPITSYSSGNNSHAEIAARIAHELSLQEHGLEAVVDDAREFFHRTEAEVSRLDDEEEEAEVIENDDGDEEFEFAFVCGVPETSLISADVIFHNGKIRPMYEYSSLINIARPPHTGGSREENGKQRPRRPPLKLLMTEGDRGAAGERPEPGFSCSSDELAGVAPGTYCVWVPREEPGKRCRKSSSTGSSYRRWKLKHLLLNRSNSDGRTDVLSVPSQARAEGERSAAGDGARARGSTESLDGKWRRPYLPYRTDLVGVFANVNGLSRNLHPFP